MRIPRQKDLDAGQDDLTIIVFGYEYTKMHLFSSSRITDQSVGVYVLTSGYEMIGFEIKVHPLYPKLQSYLKMFYIIHLLFNLDFYTKSSFPQQTHLP